jgi:histidyl-tRNA synthetase
MVAAKRREIPFPLRWFSIPNVFRYERPQRGRLREHYQLNVDLVGVATEAADVEIVRIAAELLQQFGAKESDFKIHINDRKLLSAACREAGIPVEKTADYLRLLDKKNKMPPAEFSEALSHIAAIDPLDYIEKDTSGTVAAEKKNVMDMVEQLKALGISNVVFDPTVTRGFDYYTGMVFEVFDTNPENTRSLFGGGRYDGLVSLFGGDPIPAVGFGMGDVTLVDFLQTHNLVPVTSASPVVFLGTPPGAQAGHTTSHEALKLADQLRNEGVSVFLNLSDKSLGEQVKEAVRRAIPFFIAYGNDEIESGTVRVKTLLTGEEITLPLSDLSKYLLSSSAA